MAKEAGKYDNARKHNREVSEKLDMIIDKMIQRDKNHRYSNCEELIRDLDNLGLEHQSLSFITGADGVAAKRTVAAGLDGKQPKVKLPPVAMTSADIAMEATEKLAAKDSVSWYVKHTNAKGQQVLSKMQAAQIQQMVKAELLDIKATAKRGEKGEFAPLGSYPEFEAYVKKRVTKESAQKRAGNMKEMYAQIEKEQKKRKIFRWIRDKVEGALGGVGFIVYIAVICAVIYGAYLVFPFVMKFAATQMGLDKVGETSKARENPAAIPPKSDTPNP